MTVAGYAIRGGQIGRDRLRVIASVFEPTTRGLLERVGLRDGGRCLDVGCGGGDVTRLLARMVPHGEVIGTDADEVKIDLARHEAEALTNVHFRVEDVSVTVTGAPIYDLVYARFLLSHLADPEGVVASLAALLRPGGALVVEDVEVAGVLCDPPSEAFRRANELYAMTVRALGADPDIGPRLPGILRRAGLDDVRAAVVQPGGLQGDVKAVHPLTLRAIAGSAVAAGLATADDLDALAIELDRFLDRDDTFATTPRIVQSWGRRLDGVGARRQAP